MIPIHGKIQIIGNEYNTQQLRISMMNYDQIKYGNASVEMLLYSRLVSRNRKIKNSI
jgi:hypothetical protein